VENENALLFSPGDSIGLAMQLVRLIESPSLRRKLREAGRETAIAKFDIQRMTTEIEAYLQKIVTG
jgi:glycosyltransferase involved in cell wall biosynthesis